MSIIDIFLLLTYMILPCLIAFYHGVMWYKVSKQTNNQTVTTVMFAVHYIVMIFVLHMPFIVTLLSNVPLLAALFFGKYKDIINIYLLI